MKKLTDKYIESLPDNRKAQFIEILNAFRKSIPDELEEVLDGDMVRFEVPLKKYPKTYNKKPLMYASLSNRKANMTLTLTAIYNDPKAKQSFIAACSRIESKIETKNACIKIKSIDEIPLKDIEKLFKNIDYSKFIKNYEMLIKK